MDDNYVDDIVNEALGEDLPLDGVEMIAVVQTKHNSLLGFIAFLLLGLLVLALCFAARSQCTGAFVRDYSSQALVIVLLFFGIYLTWGMCHGGGLVLHLFFFASLTCAVLSIYQYTLQHQKSARHLAIAALIFSVPLLFLVPAVNFLGVLWVLIYEVALLGGIYYYLDGLSRKTKSLSGQSSATPPPTILEQLSPFAQKIA
jgi:hypothetical protein